MQIVQLKPFHHRQQDCMGIFYRFNRELDIAIRKIRGIKWSQTHKCWWLPLGSGNFELVCTALKGIANIQAKELEDYQVKRKTITATLSPAPFSRLKTPASPAWKLNDKNLQALAAFVEQLKLKAYSSSTIRTYRNEFLQLLYLLDRREVNDLTTDDLRRYFVYCADKLRLTENTLHSRINAIKFYFEQVLKREKFFWEIPRPKRHLILPKVLGEAELRRLFAAVRNLKHKAILFTAYSAGLRVSEVVNLKISDIDSDRMQIFVRKAKGKKDRYVMLSPLVLDILRSYLKQCNPMPSIYLFEGNKPGIPYSVKSAQKIFQLAKNTAGIRKQVGFHSLRHSFATHLLEKGVDTHYIKDLLGHFSIKTTEIYLHVKKESLVNILSPLDSLWQEGASDIL